MAIGNAVEKGPYVYVYDERGHQIFLKPSGSGSNDGLKGYTSNTVNIRRGPFIYTYNEKGTQVAAKPAK